MVNTGSPKTMQTNRSFVTLESHHACTVLEKVWYTYLQETYLNIIPKWADVLATSTNGSGSGGPGFSSLRPNPPGTNVPVPSPSRDTNQWEIPIPTIPRAAHPSTSPMAMNPIAGGTHTMFCGKPSTASWIISRSDSWRDSMNWNVIKTVADSHYNDTRATH